MDFRRLKLCEFVYTCRCSTSRSFAHSPPIYCTDLNCNNVRVIYPFAPYGCAHGRIVFVFETTGWIFSFKISMELSKTAFVQRHEHLPMYLLWARAKYFDQLTGWCGMSQTTAPVSSRIDWSEAAQCLFLHCYDFSSMCCPLSGIWIEECCRSLNALFLVSSLDDSVISIDNLISTPVKLRLIANCHSHILVLIYT